MLESNGKRGTYDLNGPGFRGVADGPGQEATERFREVHTRKGYTVSTRTPAKGKGWNECLQQRGRTRERRERYQASAR